MLHSVIISDVHLCEAVPGDGLWLRYRQRRFFPDQDLAALTDWMLQTTDHDSLEIIFNGDLFDFDAALVDDGQVNLKHRSDTEPGAVVALHRILDDHPVFLAALGRVLAAGQRIVFLSGNHDVQLTFPRVRQALRERLMKANMKDASADTEGSAGQVSFYSWFYQTPSGVHVEHGNQYDRYCAFRYPSEPFTEEGNVQPTVGSLTHKHFISKLGYFNPHVDSTFMLTLPKYLWHWLRYYLFTRRSMLRVWVRGTYDVMLTTWKKRSQPNAEKEKRLLNEEPLLALRPDQVRQHMTLFEKPDAGLRVFRELWLHRIAIFTAGTVAALEALHLGTVMTMIKAAGVVTASVIGYELALPKPKLDETYAQIDQRAKKIARIYGLVGVVLGHTHLPHGKWEEGVFFGNSGTWSPSFYDIECTRPVSTNRPVIWLRKNDNSPLEGGLYVWNGESGLTQEEG